MDDLVRKLRDGASTVLPAEPVVFAYLFGSHATGMTHPRSDVDVAVYLEPEVPRQTCLDLQLRLPTTLGEATGVGNIEVLILNQAPLALRGRAIRDGILFYSKDEPARVRYEGKTLKEFFDFEIHARPLAEQTLKDIAAGRR